MPNKNLKLGVGCGSFKLENAIKKRQFAPLPRHREIPVHDHLIGREPRREHWVGRYEPGGDYGMARLKSTESKSVSV